MEEKKEGCASILSVVCQICKKINKIKTSRQHQFGMRGPQPYDVNSRIALGAIDNGIGYSHIKSFLTTLDIPSINKSAYKRREQEIGVAIEAVAANSCEMALENETEIEKTNGKVPDEDGLLPLAVSYDMQWLKRGKANDSLTGHGAIIGSKTKQIISFASANKVCRICDNAKSKGVKAARHDCRLNHKGSSKSMEAQVGVKLFSEAPNNGVKYSVFIGDDDSSTIAKIREEVDYNVEKWSDTTHASRTLVNHLHKIRQEQQSCDGESTLSPKVIDYFKKCFSYCLNQNKGDPQKLKISLSAIVPHAFGNHKHCKDNNLSWCMWLKNPENYKHKDLPNGTDLKGEKLQKVLTDLFEIYTSDLVINKIVENASSQINESFHSTVGSKVPKIRFYGGSESSDQRVAAAVAQTNLGKQYLADTLRCVNIEPGTVTEKNIRSMDSEREEQKKRKATIEFKKQRRKNYLKKKSRNKSELNREEITYDSGIALNLNPDLVKQANVTPETFKEIENTVPCFTCRPPKKYVKCPTGEISGGNFVFVVFDTETSCGGKAAEIIQLAAQTKEGQTFSKYTLPEKNISPHATRVNKLQTTWMGGRKVLHRGGIFLETVTHQECLKLFVGFLEEISSLNVPADHSSSINIVLIGHNANTFDTPVLLRTILQYCPELVPKLKDLNIHFADSLILFRNFVKDKREALKAADGSFVNINQAALYKHLFNSDFNSHDAVEDVKALTKILFNSSIATTVSEIINKSNTAKLSSAMEDLAYLDTSHRLLKSFDEVIRSGVVKRSLAKRLADSGIGLNDLENLWKAHGEQGLAILANPPTSTKRSARRPRGTSDVVPLNALVNHFRVRLPAVGAT